MRSVRFSFVTLSWLTCVILTVGITWHFLRTAEAQAIPAADGEFEFAHAQLYDRDTCETVVYSTATGQSWYRTGTNWNKIAEPTPLPRGKYEVHLIPSRQDGYRSFRLDKLTGQTWHFQAKDLKWIPFEPLGK